MNIDHLVISYDNKLFIPVDVPGDDNYLFRVLVATDIIPISDSKIICSDLSISTKTLLNNGLVHGQKIRNYFNNIEMFSKG